MVDAFSDPAIHREKPICMIEYPTELYDAQVAGEGRPCPGGGRVFLC
jgi:hypothetical protein